MKRGLACLLLGLLVAGLALAETEGFACENEKLFIGFSPCGSIIRFHDKAGNSDVSQSSDGALWRITVAAGGETKVLAPPEAERFTHDSSGSGALRMSWEGFPGLAKDISVGVTVRLDEKVSLSSWDLNIRKPDSAHVSEVRFPQVHGLAQHEGESLAVPVWTGQLLPNPRSVLCASEGSRLAWNYPGMMAMQCVAYCAESGAGLYAACDDASAFRKTFAFSGDKFGKVDFEFVHYPENGAANSEEWRMPYTAILGTLRGNWYDAAERYRGWALNQAWAKKSRVQRRLVSEWLSETGVWIWNRGRSDGVLPPAIALREKLGLPVSVFWHWWHGCPYDAGFPEYLPPREGAEHFREAVANAHAHGIKCIVYMNQRLWGMSTESWRTRNAERFAVKAEDGKVHPEVYNIFTKSPMASMCIATPFWRNTYAGIAQRAIAEFGVDGIYMDQACDSMPCYDLSHGHAIGGGRYWLEGFRLLSADIRERANQIPPRGGQGGVRRESNGNPIALTGEGCCEAWLPYLDVMLTLQVSKERYSAPTDPWEPIPFFHAVYHSVATTYGSYSSLTMPPYDDLWPKESAPKEPLALLDRKFSHQFYLEQARAFVWGQQPTLANFLPNQFADRAEELDYIMRIAKVRHLAKQYLERGEFLRPPQLNVATATSPFSRLSIYAGQGEHLTEFSKTHSLALATAWRASDGNIGIAIASLADESLSVVLAWNANEYHMPSRGNLSRIDESGNSIIQSFQSPPSSQTLTLPARAVWILAFANDDVSHYLKNDSCP